MIEARDNKLMVKRNNDYIMVKGRFPRLRQREAAERLKEIKKLVLAM
jgi:hypothetical protein